ncbi:MFS general substrate transporter [Thozetella sp. PMI_491]|nr:MFS general substrate transporter [Thozetella sp. PMI_491]
MLEHQLYRARVISSVAATVISLACGTNYVYSAWAPQYADRLHLTTTESNLIGLAGNLGMYTLGVPIGMFVDNRGTRPAVLAGAILLGIGYFPFKASFESGSGSVPLMCFFSYLTGLGGCMAFAASVKTSALNWPHHRGTATAFPLAAFGLSAFFFASFGGIFFPGDTSDFLMLLAVGTFGLTFIGFFFLKVFPHTSYRPVPAGPGMSGSQQLKRTASQEDRARRLGKGFPDEEPGMLSSAPGTSYPVSAAPATLLQVTSEADRAESSISGSRGTDVENPPAPTPSSVPPALAEDEDRDDHTETSSLMSKSSSLPGDVLVQSSVDMDRSHRVDIRGLQLLKSLEFWQLFTIMGILAGIGLMTINNIGHDANALWKHYDESVSEEFLVHSQQMHVSILSVGSFMGRMLSGVGSDFLVKVLRASRVWCLVIASGIFCIAQLCALNVTNPHYLIFVSSLSGLGYGFLFGGFPSIVAETFGIHGLSQNWGFMTLSPIISGNIFNLFYGMVFDAHSIVGPNGERSCPDGLQCYWAAYMVTLGACGLGFIVTLLVIRHQYYQRLREEGKGPAED